jgi:hypothetical protein
LFGLLLAAVLAVGVAAAVVVSNRSGSASAPPRLTTVRGVVGSEKLPFFQDRDVTAAFAKAGYRLQVDAAGSRQIVGGVDLSRYDFAFPAGAPQGDRIKRDRRASRSYVPFFTPMTIATFKPIAQLLVRAGVARPASAYYMFDVARFLQLTSKGTRWSQLPGNTSYVTDKSVLVSTTDVRTSNSAAMYLSLLSYVAAGDNVVTDDAGADRAATSVAPLFLKQGYLESTTQEPFDDFLSIGIGKTPMALVYESQYLARAAAGDGSITPDMTLMYPTPTTYAKHTFVPLTDPGDAVGRLLASDPRLRELAVRYGFRTGDAAAVRRFAADHGLPAPPPLVDVVDPPTYEVLERMITRIDRLYKTGVS